MQIDHQIIFEDEHSMAGLPKCDYQYLWTRDGIYVRAERENMKATIYHTATAEIEGLGDINPTVEVPERVPVELVQQMLNYAYQCSPSGALFFLTYEAQEGFNGWRLIIPNQNQETGTAQLVDPSNPNQGRALIEVRSGGEGAAAFTAEEDAEGRRSFRIHAVLGRMGSQPEIAVRVGIYGHYMSLLANGIFELPNGTMDVLCFNLGVNNDPLCRAS
jgi:hypothetical protein